MFKPLYFLFLYLIIVSVISLIISQIPKPYSIISPNPISNAEPLTIIATTGNIKIADIVTAKIVNIVIINPPFLIIILVYCANKKEESYLDSTFIATKTSYKSVIIIPFFLQISEYCNNNPHIFECCLSVAS